TASVVLATSIPTNTDIGFSPRLKGRALLPAHACAVRAADSFNCSGFGKSLECGRPGSHTCFTAPRLVGVPHSALTYTLGQNEDTSALARERHSRPGSLPRAPGCQPRRRTGI